MKNLYKYLLLVCLLTSCFSPSDYGNSLKVVQTMSDNLAKQNPDINQIEASNIMGEDYILIDVRDTEEMNISMLPNSISQAEFEENFNKYHQLKLIPYDTIGMRSHIYATKLKRQGLNVYNLKGGVLSWAHAKRSFYKGKDKTNKVHVQSEAWNLLPKGYKGVFK